MNGLARPVGNDAVLISCETGGEVPPVRREFSSSTREGAIDPERPASLSWTHHQNWVQPLHLFAGLLNGFR